MFGDREAVGHPGDEIADPPRTFGLGVLAIRGPPFGGQNGRHLLIAREQVGQDLLGIVHDSHHPWMPIHPLRQEGFDPGLCLRHLGRERDEDPAMAADILDRFRLSGLQTLARLGDHCPDQIRDQFAHQFGAAPVFIEIGIMLSDPGDHLRGARHHLEIVNRKQAGPQAIVDVVGVIGDVVGDRRDLRLQRGKAP